MDGDASAYAALGLYPDAEPEEVDRAYRRLIKRHHPDRPGGDAARAAEINRAYRTLRAKPGQEELALTHEDDVFGRTSGWVRAAMVMIGGLLILVCATGPGTTLLHKLLQPPQLTSTGSAAAAAMADPMDLPIHDPVVIHAVRDAARMLRQKDGNGLLSASRECHRRLRLRPSIDSLDRCSAFDDAVVVLQDHDPMWDRGPFSQLAVTGRQWSAAAALSNDYLAVDGRLERIRLQVELALASEPSEP